MKTNLKVTLLSFTLALTVGCSTASKNIAATYVSPNQYASYDCEQLEAEQRRLSGRITQLGGRLDEAASNDAALTGVALVLFWPAVFALGGTKEQEAEYARLMGENEALNTTLIMKKCGLTEVSTTQGE